MEKIIEIKKCKHCGVKFEITDKDLEFYDKISPVFNTEKFQIPSSSLCPECRQKRRLIWRKERGLFKRTCDATGKEIISMYSPDKNDIKVYSEDVWWSDKWNALEYGIDFDFSKNFFDQYSEFIKNVPHKTLINNFKTNENSSFGNNTGNNKNCYLVFEAGSLEDTMYSENVRKCKLLLDSSGSIYCEESYELIDCYKVYKSYFSQDLNECKNLEYCINCTNCEFCFLSYDLSGKKYYILNEKYSKDEYFDKINQYKNNYNSYELRNKLREKSKFRIVKSYHGFGNEDTSGDYIYNSNNSHNCFDAKNLENSKYCTVISSSKDICNTCYDYDYFGNSELSYEIVTVGQNTYNSMFCVNTWDNVSSSFYCIECNQISNCFACYGLVNKQYCILNKQYIKEQYEELIPKIIKHMQKTGEWGEFFPSILSPFGYNETVAQEYYPLEKEEVKERGFNWSDYESPHPKVEKIIPASKLPGNIEEIPDDILNWAIECEVTKKPFRIIKAELEFYRKHSLGVPRKHPDQRHKERMSLRNPRKLYDRKCDKCGVDIKTTYSPDREELIYCEDCYNKEVY